MLASNSQCRFLRNSAAIFFGLAVFCAVVVADFLLIGFLQYATGSGLMGICGPYGSDFWIYVMLAVLFAGPIAGAVLGVIIGRRLFRGYSMPSLL